MSTHRIRSIRGLAPVSMMAAAAILVSSAHAQQPSPASVEEQRKAMARLDYMVGEWHGDGWMERGSRSTFAGGERVQRKLDGLALLVEGDFARPEAPDISVHKTLGVIYYDPATKKYHFDTWLAAGSHGRHELEMLDDGWRWMIPAGTGTIRFTMRRGTNGEWFEIGERTTDGTLWTKFFEMTLRKREG